MVYILPDTHCWHDDGAEHTSTYMVEHFYCCNCGAKMERHSKLSTKHREGHGKFWKADGALHAYDSEVQYLDGATRTCPEQDDSVKAVPA